jgi:hypothetical protein
LLAERRNQPRDPLADAEQERLQLLPEVQEYMQQMGVRVKRPSCDAKSVMARILLAVCACIAYTDCMQYTIRGIPAIVDHAIRARARAAGKSLNEAVVDALAEGAGVAGTPRKRRDLGDIAGTWKADKALESALAAQDRVDEDLWR